MPFKEKTNKTIEVNKKTTVTLDSKHNEKLQEFENDKKNIIPKIRNKIKLFEKRMKNDNTDLEEQLDITDKIRKLKNEIRSLRKKKKEYLLNNSKYVFNYFENKKNISEGQSKKILLNSYFNVSGNEKKVNDKNKNNVQSYLENVDTSFLDVNNFITENNISRQPKDYQFQHYTNIYSNVRIRTNLNIS